MKVFFPLTLVTLAASFRGIGAVSSCLNPENNNYRCDSSGNELDLSDCDITDSDVDDGSLRNCISAFGKPDIETLFLNYNELSTVPRGLFKGLVSLKELYLHQNKLSKLPNKFLKDSASLEMLDLHNNELISLPKRVFAGLDSLRDLDLESNELSTLRKAVFGRLESLRFLNLLSNDLACLPTLPDIRTLFVDDGLDECGGD